VTSTVASARGNSLENEWRRLELLASAALARRKGQSASREDFAELQRLVGATQASRRLPPLGPVSERWGLGRLDLDVLLCALGPDADPTLGWTFHDMQPGVGSVYPSPALLQELLLLDDEAKRALRLRLAPRSALGAGGFLEMEPGEPFRPLRPTALAREVILGHSLYTKHLPGAVAIEARATWQSLILPKRCSDGLKEFVSWMTHRKTVVEEWGGALIGGPIALFAGPSGTGKTMAAEVVANAVNLPLYRVDMGLLVSKYIGETEKNINALLDAAARAILLFDEAESLFGKRGDVKEARDRYANMEISHLLSRIERHPWPCILTTNLPQQLDPAFARRFQVVLDFPRPDTAARALLWKMHFPPRAPLSPDLNMHELGACCELTGAQIRNAALHAAYLAAAAGSPISLEHVASAVHTELGKSGHEVVRFALGSLARFLPTEDS
jgi:hypothetical protein